MPLRKCNQMTKHRLPIRSKNVAVLSAQLTFAFWLQSIFYASQISLHIQWITSLLTSFAFYLFKFFYFGFICRELLVFVHFVLFLFGQNKRIYWNIKFALFYFITRYNLSACIYLFIDFSMHIFHATWAPRCKIGIVLILWCLWIFSRTRISHDFD